MPRPFPQQVRRQHRQYSQGTVWGTICQNDPRRVGTLSSSFLYSPKLTDLPLSEEALPAYEELFLYACPKFITANPPPYDNPIAMNALLSPTSPLESPTSAQPSSTDAAHRHLSLFLADVAAQAPVPTLRSFLKLYTSLGAKKLASFLDADEEEMVQEMMVVKQASRSVSRAGTEGTGLLDGQTITTSDLNFVIDEVRFLLAF
jgi:translation initiation factor 3 subunit L